MRVKCTKFKFKIVFTLLVYEKNTTYSFLTNLSNCVCDSFFGDKINVKPKSNQIHKKCLSPYSRELYKSTVWINKTYTSILKYLHIQASHPHCDFGGVIMKAIYPPTHTIFTMLNVCLYNVEYIQNPSVCVAHVLFYILWKTLLDLYFVCLLLL